MEKLIAISSIGQKPLLASTVLRAAQNTAELMNPENDLAIIGLTFYPDSYRFLVKDYGFKVHGVDNVCHGGDYSRSYWASLEAMKVDAVFPTEPREVSAYATRGHYIFKGAVVAPRGTLGELIHSRTAMGDPEKGTLAGVHTPVFYLEQPIDVGSGLSIVPRRSDGLSENRLIATTEESLEKASAYVREIGGDYVAVREYQSHPRDMITAQLLVWDGQLVDIAQAQWGYTDIGPGPAEPIGVSGSQVPFLNRIVELLGDNAHGLISVDYLWSYSDEVVMRISGCMSEHLPLMGDKGVEVLTKAMLLSVGENIRVPSR